MSCADVINATVSDGGFPGDAGSAHDGGSGVLETACEVSFCAGDVAITCPTADITLQCSAFGGTCRKASDPASNADFDWCDCGEVPEGAAQCLSVRAGVACISGVGLSAECPPGTYCSVAQDVQHAVVCNCDDAQDGVCPDAACIDDPDCRACTPSCDGKACGENGCNGTCGTCALGSSCEAGHCVATCVPKCAGLACGDDGCGGECGRCGIGMACGAGQCAGETCTPNCNGFICGGDGCGGSCGTCPSPDKQWCPTGTQCLCFPLNKQEYTFDGSGISWSSDDSTDYVVAVNLRVRQVAEDGTLSAFKHTGFHATSPNASVFFLGCWPKIEIQRHYTVFNKSAKSTYTCEGLPEIVEGARMITIPAPVITSGVGCTVPPL